MLRHPLARFAIGFAFSAAIAWVLFRLIGAIGIVASAPIFGLTLARPLMDIVAGGVRSARALALHDLEGRHYEFKGTPIDVVEDAAGHRWLRVEDVRAILSGLPADRALGRVLGRGFLAGDLSQAARVQAEALVGFLRNAHDPRSLRFRHWVERVVVLPADKRRERGG